MTDDRRRSPRFCPKEETFARIKSVLPARIVDISVYGAQLEVTQSLQRRAEYRFSIPLPEGDLLLRALVRRCTLTGLRAVTAADLGNQASRPQEGERVAVYRVGLEFVDPRPEQVEALQRYCSTLQLKTDQPLLAMA